MKQRPVMLAALFAICTSIAEGHAENTSFYTDIGMDKCVEEKTAPINPVHTGTWNCAGYENIRVQLMEMDLRILVSYQFGAESTPENGQTIPRFNTLESGHLEWRLDVNNRPIATILRFKTDDDSVLVVTKIGGPAQSCQVGLVSAKSVANANEIARKVADEVAPGFRCGKDRARDYNASSVNSRSE